MKNLAVVLLNYNGKHFLEKFLPTVIKFSPEADVIIIDNCSTDDSVTFLRNNFSSTKLIQLEKNYGFAEGYNLGLEKLKHEYFILLNTDVEVTEGWINPLMEMSLRNRDVVAIQPKIRDYKAPEMFEYAGAAGGFMDVLGYPFCRGRVFDTLEKDNGQYNDKKEIFWATGACFFVRSEVFKSLKGFDPKFFAHMEEIDLCWRIHNKGFTIAYQPLSTVYHVGGGTLKVENPFKTYLNYRNNLAMMFKNLPAGLLFPLIFTRLVLDGISGVRFLFQGSFANIWAIIKAHFAFYGMIPYLWKKRAKSLDGFDKLYSGSIIWQYFVNKKKTYSEICSK